MASTFVLLHGTPLSPAVWDETAAHLAGRADVVCPDVLLDKGEDIDDLVARLVAHLPAAKPTHVVGHSFGGEAALDLALAVPERVTTLTLICARDTPFPAFHHTAGLLRTGGPIEVDATLRRWFRPDELGAESPVIDYARHCLATADRSAWARCLDAIATFDRSTKVSDLHVPTHLIAAGHDTVSTVDAMTALAGRLPRAHLTLLPEAAHMSMFLRPDVLADRLTATMLDVPPG